MVKRQLYSREKVYSNREYVECCMLIQIPSSFENAYIHTKNESRHRCTLYQGYIDYQHASTLIMNKLTL